MDKKQAVSVFTNQVKHADQERRAELLRDPFYRLTNVQDVSGEEAVEILSEIEGLSNDDLAIVSTKRFAVRAKADVEGIA